jgi:hypothetical protein
MLAFWNRKDKENIQEKYNNFITNFNSINLECFELFGSGAAGLNVRVIPEIFLRFSRVSL